MEITQYLAMQIKHFILTDDGRIEEYSSEQAMSVANGQVAIPSFAGTTQRYLQVQFDEEQTSAKGELVVTTAGALVHFDKDGKLTGAGAPDEDENPITRFEFDTCVQLALQGTVEEIRDVH